MSSSRVRYFCMTSSLERSQICHDFWDTLKTGRPTKYSLTTCFELRLRGHPLTRMATIICVLCGFNYAYAQGVRDMQPSNNHNCLLVPIDWPLGPSESQLYIRHQL